MRPAPRGTDRPLLEAGFGTRRGVSLTGGWQPGPAFAELPASETHVWALEAVTREDRERLTREILARYTGLEPGALAIDRMPSGKPVLATTGRCTGLRYNASDCGALCVLALRRDADVGVDVEAIHAVPEDIAFRAMTEIERDAYRQAPVEHRAACFFGLWTAKEAATKVRGRGLREPFDAFEAADKARLGGDGAFDDVWIRRLPSPRTGHAAAVASTAPFDALRLWNFAKSTEA